MTVSEYSNGFTLSLRSCAASSYKTRIQQSKRGKVSGFSRKSCKRLRHLLMRLDRSSGVTLAFTLTMPSKISPEDWRKLFERYRTSLTRAGLSLIWRVELQKRKVPHLHCVSQCDTIDAAFVFWQKWVEACDNVYEPFEKAEDISEISVASHAGFLLYGFSCRCVCGSGWLSYVAAHTAKNKKSQLGWLGRQWGIVNERKIKYTESREVTYDDGFVIFLGRCIRKRFRFSRLDVYRNFGSYDFFCSPSFLDKAKKWYYRDLPF